MGFARVLILVLSCTLPLVGALAYFFWWPGYESTKTIYSTFKILQFLLPLLAWATYGNIKISCQSLFAASTPTSRQFSASRPSASRQSFVAGLISAAVFLGAGLAAYFLIFRKTLNVPGVRQALTEKLAEFGVFSIFSFCILAFLLAILHSFLEEYYWRGFVLVELQKYFSSRWAVILSALAFTLHHVVVITRYAQIENRMFVIFCASTVVFACGVFWAWQFSKFQNIYTIWLSHIAADLVILGIGYDIIFRL